MIALRRLVGALFLLGFPGCATPQPEPIDARELEAEFRARTLQDPGLRRFVEANPGPRSAPFPPPRWDLRTLTLVAFYYHPELDVARARLAQARAGEQTAGMWPNPVAAFEFTKVKNVEPGFKPWVYGMNLSIPVDTLWKRGYRVEEAEHVSEGAALALAEAGWKVRSRLRAALADHLFWLQELELRREEAAAREGVVAALARKLELGEIFRLDVDAARGELHASRLATHTASGRVAETRAALAGALGVPAAALQGLDFDWPELGTPPDLQSLALDKVQEPGLLHRLDLRFLLAEYAAAEAALQREIVGRYPDVSILPGYQYDQGQKKLSLGLSVSLPILNQNGGPIAEADARRKEIAARFHALQASAIGDSETSQERYRAALAELGEAGRSLDLIARRETAVRRAIELKDLDPTALTGVRLEKVQLSLSRLGALRHAEEALGSLEDAFQRPLGLRAGVPVGEDPGPGEGN